MVRVPAEKSREKLEEIIEHMMIPYCEHENDGKTLPYFAFKDHEDEERKRYETELTDAVKLEDGTLVSPYDPRFKNPNVFASFSSDSHVVPEHLEKVKIPFKERYATFEIFMKEYSGEERDEKTGRYGYWRNPNKKWDYWRIGGRWRGHLMVKQGTSDVILNEEVPWEFGNEFHKGNVPGGATEVDGCRISALDPEKITKEARTKADKFWAEVDQLLAGHEFPVFEGPRDGLLDLGVLECGNEDEMPSVVFWKQKWNRQIKPGVDRYDYIKEKPSRDKLDERVVDFMNPIRTYAFLDDKGWHARGEMGWFGMGSDTPESNKEFCESFTKWLASGNQSDWIVVLDCHI
jgi:hypothetical protein